ncbi:MAG TPA: hypothetical protein VMT64_03880, partial [Candidatus Binataceae bacterium]|nr:hypothetical protein [Candidatus Binataceae bacterium]
MRPTRRAIAVLALLVISAGIFASALARKPMAAVLKPDFANWTNDRITLSNLGHATLLMNFMGVRAISDPSLFDRVGLSIDSILTIGPQRISAPPLTSAELQNIQLILITHAPS